MANAIAGEAELGFWFVWLTVIFGVVVKVERGNVRAPERQECCSRPPHQSGAQDVRIRGTEVLHELSE